MNKNLEDQKREKSIILGRELLRNGTMEEVEDLLNNESDSFKLAIFLNNIHINVLGMRIEDEIIRKNEIIQEIQNRKRIESGYYDKEDNKKTHSALWLNQSPSEFEQYCEEILLSHGIDINELSKEFLKLRKEYDEMKEFKRKFIPIYIILRKLGYTHTDLVA